MKASRYAYHLICWNIFPLSFYIVPYFAYNSSPKIIKPANKRTFPLLGIISEWGGEMSEVFHTQKRRKRVKLIFNPRSGAAKSSPNLLTDVIELMQAWKLVPEVYLPDPEADMAAMAAEALTRGMTMFVACGGDGTVSAVSKAIAGLPVTLGILPAGIQNNIALSLGIPRDIPEAIAVLRNGRRIKIDLGMLDFRGTQTPFMEVCTVGLTSSIFASADEIQHGRLDKIGDFLSTLISSAPSEIRMLIDGKHRLTSLGHVLAVSNMPYAGRNFRIGSLQAYRDGLLDILFLGDLPKLKLLGYAVKKHAAHELNDPRIQSFQARRLEIETDPPMTVMADGVVFGEGPISIGIRRRALGVMVPEPAKQEE